MTNIFEKISSGYYEVPYREKPKRPEVLGKPAYKLTDMEAAELPAILAKHNEEVSDFLRARTADRERARELEAEFERDALAYVGLADHPKATKLFNFVWQEKHSYSRTEVVSFLSELAEALL